MRRYYLHTRHGEILGLKLSDVGERILNIRHSWSDYDGLKAPKNEEARRIPLLPEVRAKLLELTLDNPYGPEGFLFYGSLPDKPINRNILLDGLQDALLEALLRRLYGGPYDRRPGEPYYRS